jgi:predicted GNAT superfamily acetyltransferase
VLGAWVQDQLVGFVQSFIALTSGGITYHHSHMAAVLPEYRSLGIGFALKQEQARRVAQQDLPLIAWTFDPLETRNAHFNFNRLGAVARTYLVNHYGILDDGLNRGVDSDRFEVEQWLTSVRVQTCLLNPSQKPDPVHPQAHHCLADWQHDMPQPPEDTPAFSLPETMIEVPGNFQQIKQIDMGLARAWRIYFRLACQKAFSDGFVVVALHHVPPMKASASADRTFYLFRQLSPGPVF